ncbi:hypothetical protein TTY48_31290 [Tsukamurella sp. TY48]|nr:hypothetical protein TTY48_31290 [Tsukamurella sp. TY48]
MHHDRFIAVNKVRVVRAVGDAGWWAYVVAMMLVFQQMGSGWTAYVPLTDAKRYSNGVPSAFGYFEQLNAVSTLGAIGLGSAVTTSIVTALWLPTRRARAIAVAAPLLGALIVWLASKPLAELDVLAAFFGFLAGIAVREAGTRWSLRSLPRGTQE